jgi:kumamolisin
MQRYKTIIVACLAIALAVVMILSPLGAPYMATAEEDISGGMATIGAAFEAMFPGAVNAGPLPETQELRVGVSLPVQNPDQLNSFIQAVSTPGSPQFRQFITATQFTNTYSPSAASYSALESYFEGYGLHMETFSNRLTLGVVGSPSQMGAAFHTSFAQFKFSNGQSYYGPTSSPLVPASLGITGSFGFTNALFYKPVVSMATTPTTDGGMSPLATCNTYDTPTQVRTAYLVTSLPAGDTGTGEKMAVVDGYDSGDKQATLTTDLSTFDTTCGVAAPPTLIFNYPVASTTYNSSASSGWGGESDLDMQWSHVMAPGATLEMSFSPDAGNGLYEAVDALVAGDEVNGISLSWGEAEVGIYYGTTCTFWCNASTDGSITEFHPILQAAAAEGISVFVAAGDCGAADGTTTATTDYPSSDVYATGVGGTVLNTTGNNYASEWAWSGNESNCPNNDGGAGGGWGTEPQPWYQSGTGVKNKGLRGDPDVGITVGTYLVIWYEGAKNGECGTSDGGPMWVGLAMVADQIHGGNIGLINPVLYSILRSTSYSTSFHDITTGYNGYKATTGWDPVTGVGTPIANVAIPEIAAGGFLPTQPGITAKISASTTTPAVNTAVTLTANATGGTGTYTKYGFDTGNGNTTITSKSSITVKYALAGPFSACVTVFDSKGNSSTSPCIQILVGTTAFTLTLAASTTSPALGSAVTFTVTASGGTTPYYYIYSYGDGTWSQQVTVTSYLHTYFSAGVYCAQANATDSKTPTREGAMSNVVTIDAGGATGSCSSTPLTAGNFNLNRTGPGETNFAVNMYANYTGGTGAITALWCWGDGTKSTSLPVAGTPAVGSYVYTKAGTYTPRVYINDSGSSSVLIVATTSITVVTLVTVTDVAPSSGNTWTPPTNLTFTAPIAGGESPFTYSWNFDNGNTSTVAAPPYQIYYKPGTYLVSLTVTDSLSKHAFASYSFTVFGTGSTITLQKGQNLVALPTVYNSYTLYELSVIAGPSFAGMDMLKGLTSTLYDRTTDAANGNTALVGGEALWLNVSSAETITVYGNTTGVGTLTGVTYGAGWSGIGWSVSTATTASALAAKFTGARMISIWSTTTGQWATFIVGLDTGGGPHDFSIAVGSAVLVYATGSGTVTE